MKYIFVNDFLTYFKHNKKIWISYIAIILLSILFGNLIGLSFYDSIIMSLGLNCSISSGILEIIMYILNIGFFILEVLIVLSSDVQFNCSNLFLRIDINRWIIAKIFSIVFITFNLKIITFVTIFVVGLLKNYIISSFIDIFIANYLFILFVQFLFFLLYIIVFNNRRLILFSIIIALTFIKYLFINNYEINKLFIMSIIIIIWILLFCFKSKIKNLFEH